MKSNITVLLFNDFTNDNRVFKECKTLVNNGYEVELIATAFDKTLPKEEVIEGFTIHRLGVGGFKLLPYNLFLFWIQIIFKYNKSRIFHCNDLYALPPAYFLKIFNRDIKIVYDCHEHETEAQIYNGKKILKWLAQIFERLMIYSADEIICVSESIANDYVNIYDIEKPKLVLNSPSYINFKKENLFREELGIPKEKEIFLFQGKYMPGRGIDNLVEVFEELEEKNKDIVLVFLVYGEGVEELRDRIKNNKNMYWHEKVPVSNYMKYVSSADWGIYLMENTCKNNDYALPNKVFDYVLGGLPVVVSNLTEIGNFVRSNKLGYVVDSNNKEEVVEILSKIDKSTKKEFIPNLKSIAKKYSWEEQEKVLVKIYNSIQI